MESTVPSAPISADDPTAYREVFFPQEEFDARLQAVRARMQERGIDVLILSKPETIYYLSGFSTLGYWDPFFLVVRMSGSPAHVQFYFEDFNVERTSRWSEIFGYRADQEPMQVLSDVVRRLASNSDRVAYEKRGWFATQSEWERFSTFFGGDLSDGSGVVDRVRMVKRPLEVQYMREAARVVSRAMISGLARAQEGVSEREIAEVIYSTSIAEGGTYSSIPLIIGSGERASMPHATWTDRRLRPGDNLSMESGGCVARYHAGCIRNKIIGEPSPEQRSVAETLIEGLNAALAAIKPGVLFEDIDSACRAVIRRAGLEEYWFTPTAYPIGIGFPPFWGEASQDPVALPGDRTVVEAGMTLHVIPISLRHARPGGGQLGISETVVVTETGREVLTTVPRRLFSTVEDG